jgi:glycosyltransferase involved in cell wall biosynthesis
MLDALGRREDIDLRRVTPPFPAGKDTLVGRWLNAQPWLALARLRHRGVLLHGLASEAATAWPARRQVVTLHDVIPWTRDIRTAPTRRYLDYQAERLRRCAAIICVSQTAATEAIEQLGLEPSRVHVVPEGVEAVFSAHAAGDDVAARARLGVPDTGYVLWVGSLVHPDPRKALDVLVDAATSLEGVTLVMAGAPGEESARIAHEAGRRNLTLVLPGFVSDGDLAALYRRAAAVAVPSLHEGFGLPVLEAMACGAPVVATRAGNLPDLAAGAAVLVPPGDAAALAGAIRTLLASPPERSRLAAAGPKIASAYSWDRAAEMTVAVYREVLEVV